MGQVPHKSTRQPVYGIIGGGRVAKHFSHYFQYENISFKQWCRRDLSSCASALRSVDVVLLLISDSQIENFLSEHKNSSDLSQKKWVHFSGSIFTSKAFGAHPLMTFADQLYPGEFYRTIPFVTDNVNGTFKDIFPGLANESFKISPQQKALYHALCVVAGNFTTLLWQKAFTSFDRQLDLPGRLLLPYLNQVMGNFSVNPAAALTGPLARRDRGTINRNITALEGDPFQAVYESFVTAYETINRG